MFPRPAFPRQASQTRRNKSTRTWQRRATMSISKRWRTPQFLVAVFFHALHVAELVQLVVEGDFFRQRRRGV